MPGATMANPISDLHAKFIRFAHGMPAIAISWGQIQQEVALLARRLRGQPPTKPSPLMENMPMPVYGLAYSVFVRRLSIAPKANACEMDVEVLVTVHLEKHPELIIRH